MSGLCVHILYSNKGIHYCSFHILSCRLRVFGLVWLQRNKKSKTRFNCLYQIWQWELHFCLRKYHLPALHWRHSKERLKRKYLLTKSQHFKAETWRGKAQLIVCIKFDNWKLHLSLKKYNLPALHWSHSKEWLKRNFS